MNIQRTQIGYLVGGGLKENFRVRLTVSPQEMQEGAFVVIQSGLWNYYGIVTDINLGATDPRFADEQTEVRFPAHIAKALHGQTLYANLEVLPNLMLEVGPELGTPEYKDWQGKIDAGLKDAPRILPVKNIPPHHAVVSLANEGDIAEIFGDPNKESNFVIGYTREQNHPVCIDLDKFVQRSSGVFGATGTGKSFLTRLVLAGLMKHNQAAVLVLDMHNEYGFDDVASDTKKAVKGLKTLFKSGVRCVGLGAGSTIRGNQVDFNLEISTGDISTSDIETLSRELNLRETTPTILNALYGTFKDKWFAAFRSMSRETVMIEDERGKTKEVPAEGSVAKWAMENGVNVMAAEALHDKLRRLFSQPYIVDNPAADSVAQIIQSLEAGKHVVLSFGEHESDLDYLLVSNLLTRKIRAAWEKKTNEFRTHGKAEPKPLIIVVEEAHKLLNREMAAQTTFATIARELRKYYVTLLIVDQRPSQIYDEVMSQLGTRISGWLGDDLDIQAVLSGLSGRDSLRGMLARLQPKEEVLLLGWGVPMPLPVRSRRYDEAFWKEMSGGKKSREENLKELGFGG
ncbi:ATP-binding protein [Candidatus Villigracilis affinis]|uniref:ATP-binding protein n=1 Tax=Candidatus Villigracilis affinis TaxID=3140682 RepID=UPI002A1BD6EB|nr:ATP-binding protein [Anaerolineales bacterium]